MVGLQDDRILILTGSYGEGHRQAAFALKEAYEQSYPSSHVFVIDYMEWMHPHTHEIGRSLFVKGVSALPRLYGYFFERTRDTGLLGRSMNRLSQFTTGRLMKLLEHNQPSVVVCTFPPAAAAMSVLKKQGHTTIPSITVITDHTDHSYWLHPYTDLYLVGSEQVRLLLQAKGISPLTISVTGIPIRSRFYRSDSYDLQQLRLKYGINKDAPVLLLMGGGCGLIGTQLLKHLESPAIPDGLQLIVCCGHNARRIIELEEWVSSSKHRIIPVPFVEHIDEFMLLSDLIITKAGGLSTTEAIAMKLPMLLYRPLPGQEEDNARYLLQAGVAIRADHGTELVDKLEYILHNRTTLGFMRERASELDRGSAAQRAVKLIASIKPSHHIQEGNVTRVVPLRTKTFSAFLRFK